MNSIEDTKQSMLPCGLGVVCAQVDLLRKLEAQNYVQIATIKTLV